MLSVIVLLPLVRRRLGAARARRRDRAGAERACHRADRDASRARPRRPAMARVRHLRPRRSSMSSRSTCSRPYFSWHLGIDGHRANADCAQYLPDAAVHPRVVDQHPEPRARVYGGVPADGNADARRFREPRPVPVLCVFRRRPDPDVPDHRHLGRRASHLRELQVLPLHTARLGADDAGDAVHGWRRAYDRHSKADDL